MGKVRASKEHIRLMEKSIFPGLTASESARLEHLEQSYKYALFKLEMRTNMTQNDYKLRMIFEDVYGRTIHEVAMGVRHCVGRELEKLEPPAPLLRPMSFEEVAAVLKKRQLRKDEFMDAAKRLGQKLAESMEDKEGWHGEDRQTKHLGEGR